jgi:hypothetical protein
MEKEPKKINYIKCFRKVRLKENNLECFGECGIEKGLCFIAFVLVIGYAKYML